jgi:SecD/SecF fusion protein
MGQDTRAKFIGILILTIIAAYIVAPIPNKPKIPMLSDAKINKGIDLAGGAELRYKVLFPPGFTGSREAATRTATDIIRRRVEMKQLKEPKINSHGEEEIVIQLAGIDSDMLRDYKRIIQTTGKLTLHAAAPKSIQEQYNRDKVVPQEYMVVENVDRGQRGGEYEAWGAQILVKKNPVIEGRHIEQSEPQQQMVPGGARWVTSFTLNAEGAKMFDEAAEVLYNQRPPGLIVIMLDDKVKSAPAVQSASFHGHGQISGAKDQDDAKELSIILKSGSLPAPIGTIENGQPIAGKPESETFVGPTLGEDAIRRGMMASGITVGLISLFMMVYYRTAGVIAVLSVILNVLFLLAIMAFFGATMTLPGIAGIVLTVGMAVDANILQFERMREEQLKGKTAAQCYDAGHDHAWWTIVDSNVTTLIGGIVLYYFGTGPVQGFAVTLCLGILTSLFTTLFVTKVFLKMILAGGLTEWKMMRLFASPSINFVKKARFAVFGSVLATILVMVVFFVRGEKNYGIDFKGGSMVSFMMNTPQPIDSVRDRIKTVKLESGLGKYDDAEVQTVAEPTATKFDVVKGTSRAFQMRTSFINVDELKLDIQNVFKDVLSHDPFEDMDASALDPNPRKLDGRKEGLGFYIYVKGDKADVAALKKRIAAVGPVKDILERDGQSEPLFTLEPAANPPQGLTKLKFCPTEKVSGDAENLRKLRQQIKANLADDLSQSPFLGSGKIGSSVPAELKNSTFWAFVISWALMIVYVAIRFDSWRYGVAAVVALIHDALFALGFTALAGMLIPKSWGLSFDMSLNTLAAILTIIGFSIDNTIVVFDRIRENLQLDKKTPFPELINMSINQTLSRTTLTSFTVILSAIVLYVFTATTGGGIADFSFPLIIGVMVGTYTSIFMASPLVLWWYGGKRPATT